ncbi:MAG: hypothetical protein ABIY55_32475 [Kofleriaceae bacterium]
MAANDAFRRHVPSALDAGGESEECLATHGVLDQAQIGTLAAERRAA